MSECNLEAAQVGKMFVTKVVFSYQREESPYNHETKKYDKVPAHWNIQASLAAEPDGYSNHTMTLQVEHGIGAKLAEVLLPVIVADASRKAQQLADDSKAMLQALGERAVCCITDMPKAE